MSADADVLAALAVLLTADDAGEPFDNESLAVRLGWTLEHAAACLEEMKERSLVWGVRGARKPGPWFSEIEVTVQGKRLLRSGG